MPHQHPHQRLGLRTSLKSDATNIFRPFLNLLEEHDLDFHSTFRKLSTFRPGHIQDDGEKLDDFISYVLESTPRPEKLDRAKASTDFKAWLTKYSNRILKEREEWDSVSQEMESTPRLEKLDRVRGSTDFGAWLTKYSNRILKERGERGSVSQEDVDGLRQKEMNGVNPRFVLRQWVLEEVIAKVEKDAVSGRRILAKVLKVRFRGHLVYRSNDLTVLRLDGDESI
jgi:uncharacterized protein YdiU (UPF0061 family)